MSLYLGGLIIGTGRIFASVVIWWEKAYFREGFFLGGGEAYYHNFTVCYPFTK